MDELFQERRLVSLSEAARVLSYSPRTHRRMIDEGLLPTHRLRGPKAAIRIDSRDLERLLTPKEPS